MNNNDMKVICFGEILFDVIGEKEYLGGAPANVACHLARCGVKTYMFSAVGDDARAVNALNHLTELGVQTKYILRTDRPTGIVRVDLSKPHKPDYDICTNVAYDYIEYKPEILTEILSNEWGAIYFGTVAQRSKVSMSTLRGLLKDFNGEVFYDINLRKNSYTKQILESSMKAASILKLSDDEIGVVSDIYYNTKLGFEECCKRLSNTFDIRIILVTCGEKGCLVYEDNRLDKIPATPVKVIDSIGAGDAFTAAFLSGYLSGKPAVECAGFANKLAALVVSSRGAVPEYNLKELMNN